jgi:hypothetical protein
LSAERFDGLVVNRGLAAAHDLEVPKSHGLDERTADVEAEGEHDGKGESVERRWASQGNAINAD